MDPQFGEWLRLAHLEPDHDVIQRRWAGVENAAANLSASHTLELAMLFHRLPAGDTSADWLRGILHESDNAFHMANNDAEVSVLAGAVIASAIERPDSNIGNVASFALVCPAFMGHRNQALVPEIVDRGRQYLEQESTSLRSTANATLEPNLIPHSEKSLADIKSACEANQPPNLSGPLVTLLASFDKALRKANTNVKRLNSQFALYREESDVLWWLTAAFSGDLQRPLAELPWPSTPIHIGKELAGLVRQLPGPLAHRGFIDRALDASGADRSADISLSTAVNKIDAAFQQKWMELATQSAAFPLCPVMNAISLSISSDKQTDWYAPFKSAMAVAANTKLTPLDLATQVFHESLLIRSAQSDNS